MLRTITAKRNGLWAKVPIVPFEGQEAYKPSDKDMLRAKIEEHIAKRERYCTTRMGLLFSRVKRHLHLKRL